jgi:Bifunctional DNA primase/polymerase, N-terminal/Primase C terminal 2 (PriCT-2)
MTLEVALRIAQDWPVFPCKPTLTKDEGSKAPFTPNGFKDATKDETTIRQWWTQWPKALIGVPMGGASGILCVDLDRKDGVDGIATWDAWVEQSGGCPETRTHRTPSTGKHVLFKHRDGIRNIPLGKLGPGIEIKAEGGYIIVPPSRMSDGKAYTVECDVLPAEMPQWLLLIIEAYYADQERDAGESTQQDYGPTDPEKVRAALAVISSDDYEDWYRIAGAIRRELGNAGYHLFVEWSAKWPKFNSKDCEKKWKHAADIRDISVGTIFYYADQADPSWRQRYEDSHPRPGTPDDGGQHAQQDDVDWPIMAEQAFYGLAGDIVRAIEPHSEADPVALLIQILIVAGNMVGRAAYYQVESDRHYPNLFAALAGHTSKGRKGTAFGRVKNITSVADQVWTDNRIKGGLSSGEGFINEVRDRVEKWDTKLKAMVTTDPGVTDKRLMIVEAEFASTLSVTDRAGNTLSALIRKAWDGNTLETLTRSTPLRATNAHISIISHITTDELKARLTRTEMANGFANRFLFALVRRSKELPFGGNMSDSEFLHFGELLREKLWCCKGELSDEVFTGRVTMTDAAREKWASIYGGLSTAQKGLLGAITARGEAQVVRLALVYCLLDGATQIDVPHLEAGLAVWHYCEASAAYIFGESLGDPLADEINAALRQAGKRGMSRTEIYHLFSGNQKSERIGAALVLLFNNGKATRGTRPAEGRGRPAEVWLATP